MFNIEEELKKLPAKPGVYIMHDEKDNIIYVGKAISLKNRVRQYFQSSRNHSPKIVQMVSKVAYFEYIITDSELEALVLECNLIKEHRPKYNTMLKDDKSYPFIKVTVQEEYPRVLFARRMAKDRAKYFGPYTSAAAVKDTIELLCKLYRIRTCNRVFPRDFGKDRPCLNYHIKQCDALCLGNISKEEYAESVKKVIDFLNGGYTSTIRELKTRMQELAQELKYEEAAVCRDLIQNIQAVTQKQKITESDGQDRDIIACAVQGELAVVQVFFVRQGKLMGREHFMVNVSLDDSVGHIISQFIRQYYGGTPYIPGNILVQEEIEDAQVVAQWLGSLNNRKVNIYAPQRGHKEKLVELALKNAQMVLAQDSDKMIREYERTKGAVAEIAELLGLENISRMEAFDISNTSGVESVGSMVVFVDGRPKNNDYRKFRIKTVKGPNDYKSMEEVLTRRFKRGLEEKKRMDGELTSFGHMPDLLLMDGGRGQVNVALEVLKSLGINIPVCGMVKDDHHRTRGLYYNNVELPINTSGEGFKLITRIQDEAHRFAIEYHKSLRSSAQVASVLDEIEGVGPTRRRALMRYFLDIEKIREASLEELASVEGIPVSVAENIFKFFH